MDNVMCKQFYFVHLGGSYLAMPCFGPWLWSIIWQFQAKSQKANCGKSETVWSLVKWFTAVSLSIVLCKVLKMDNVMFKQFYFVHLGGSYHAMPWFGPCGWSIICHCSQVKLMQKHDCLKPCKVIHSCQSDYRPLRKSQNG
jgi:hypothetical protein